MAFAPEQSAAPEEGDDVPASTYPVASRTPVTAGFDPKAYLATFSSGTVFDPKAYLAGATAPAAPLSIADQEAMYGSVRPTTTWDRVRDRVSSAMDSLEMVHPKQEGTPGVKMRPIDAFNQVGGDLAALVINTAPYVVGGAGIEKGFGAAGPIVSKWLGRLFVGQMLYGTARSIPKWVPYPEKWPGSSSLGTEWRNDEGGPARTAHAVVDAAQAFVTGLGILHVAAPRAIESMEHAHPQDVPGKLVDAAGNIQDAEKRQSVVEAANHLADSVGVPRIVVKVELPPLPPRAESPPAAAPLKIKEDKSTSGTPTPAQPAKEGTYGIANRVTAARAKAGDVEAVESGEGIGAEASMERGRKLLAEGANPEDVMARFAKTGSINADDLAIARAHGEKLAQAASKAGKKFGYDSKEYIEASNEDSAWLKAIQPLKTEWARLGSAMQGETALDTGDFHSLRRTFTQMAGRDFTEKEAGEAQKLAKGVRNSEGEADAAKDKVLKAIKDEAPFSKGKKPEKGPVPGSVADIWKRAKDYLEAGEDDFDDIRTKIAVDTGMPVREVTKILAGPKRMRVITNEMYSKMSRRRALVAQANYWLKKQAMPGWERAITGIPGIFFRAKVRFHGTVGMVTHAGINIYNPAEWGIYWPKFVDQFRMMGWFDKGAYHEATMQELARDPNYLTARRAGLANDATRGRDDFETAFSFGSKFFSTVDAWGTRGFDTLKTYRQARFNHAWDSAPDSLRTKEYAGLLADAINHSTGYVRANIPKLATSVFFAPKLEGSRWAYALGDPVKAAKALLPGSGASPEARAIAIREVKEKAMIAGTYIGLLAANEGLLAASGSKQKINYTDPRKPDFLAFKAAGHQFGVISPMIGSLRFVVNLFHSSFQERSKAEGKDSRAEEGAALIYKYGRGKLSPFGAVAEDMRTQADFQNRPMPFSNDKVPAYLRKQGIGPYTYPEYLTETFLPIPAEDAIKEVWTNQGMSEDRINHWLGVFATVGVEAFTGARMKPDTEMQTAPSSSPRDRLMPVRDPRTTFRK